MRRKVADCAAAIVKAISVQTADQSEDEVETADWARRLMAPELKEGVRSTSADMG